MELVEIVTVLHHEGTLSAATLNALFEMNDDALEFDFTLLFEGVGKMKVPPWGSVYIDKEKVLFGESTIEYRQFLFNNDIELNSGIREPEDQFGLMLYAYAYLLEHGKIQSSRELMERHLLPWCIVYLNLLIKTYNNEFYRCLASDVIEWLNKLVFELGLKVEEKKIYIDV